MPCFHCGTRETDPEKGPSPWRRAVRAGRQVLVCPDCQEGGIWRSAVDACPECDSPDLERRLGQTFCTQCRTLGRADKPSVPEPRSADDDLSRDVAEAIERVLGRT